VDHQHIALKAVSGNELPAEMPCFRDLGNLVYGKSEAGGVLFGGYEPNPPARWLDGVPWEHGGKALPADMDRFEQLLAGAARRFPFLEGAEIVKLVCHPDAMTPDANPLLGPVPGVRGLWMAAGLSLNGFGGAGGIGRSLAEWITGGETELDMSSYRCWRFGRTHRDTTWSAELAREQYKYYYLLRYPFDQDEWGRPKRLSPLHSRMQDLGAVFGTKNGWERPDYFRPGEAWRRAGADQRSFGFARPPWFDRLEVEHRAVRERVGLLDMSSFGKIEVVGPGALALLETAACNRIDRPVGSVVYTQLLNDRGGIEADLTVTRLANDRFRVITGAATVDADMGRLRSLLTQDDSQVELRDVSDELSVIGLYGPHARDVLASVTDDEVSNEALPFLSARRIHVGGAEALAQRITYVGELGWELYVEPEWAGQVWDRLWEAGAVHRMEPVGYRTLDHLRMEKGYRYYGTDLTALDTPYEAGLGFCVSPDKEGFVGKEALAVQRERGLERRIRTLLVGGEEYVTAYGGEAIVSGNEAVGRVRSIAYGFTVRRNVAYAYLPIALEPGAKVDVEVFGELVGAEVTDDVLVDPERKSVRA
jgi:4-methylaminobutanoate oxidase (formaldehyde-forming)